MGKGAAPAAPTAPLPADRILRVVRMPRAPGDVVPPMLQAAEAMAQAAAKAVEGKAPRRP